MTIFGLDRSKSRDAVEEKLLHTSRVSQIIATVSSLRPQHNKLLGNRTTASNSQARSATDRQKINSMSPLIAYSTSHCFFPAQLLEWVLRELMVIKKKKKSKSYIYKVTCKVLKSSCNLELLLPSSF